jgi:serine/threonine-protein kinase
VHLAPGDKFDRYTIEAVLGEGGMGRVYRARDPKLDRSIALKVLRGDPDANDSSAPGHAARLLREARAAAALDHPNVVAIFDVGEVDGTPFIAMELVRGRSMRQILHDPGIPLSSKLRWLTEVARALAAAHDHGLVHRDVKPGNLLVRDDGVVKVLDFGIARRTTPVGVSDTRVTIERANDDTVTEAGTLVGTPQYMAPEQLRGLTIDGRVDQFAWGVVAYELLTGKLPWHETNGVEVLAAILFQDVVSPHLVVPGLAPEIGAVVVRALAKESSARFTSMTELVDALEPFAGAPTPPVARAPTPVPAEPAPTVLERGRARQPTPPALPRRDRRVVVIGGAAVVAVVAITVAVASRSSSSAVDAPAVVPARPVAVTDLPLPPEHDPAALAAYREGLQAYRDGIFDADVRAFERAVAVDPGFAAAHLRLSYILYPSSETAARAHYERAVQLRASLTEHDLVLLDAFEPYVRREPADVGEEQRRLKAACDRFPLDADFALYYANARFHVGVDQSMDAFERAITLDPKFGNAYAHVVEKELYLGHVDAALATAERCLREVPSATRCSLIRGMNDIVTGNCSRVEADARRAIAIDPLSTRAYRYLAAAELAADRPVQSVREALEQAWARIDEVPLRDRTRLVDMYALDVLSGDFIAAEEDAHAYEHLVAGNGSRAAHATAARELADLYEETGRTADAAAVADDFIHRQDAWVGDPRAENFAIGRDATVDMLAVLLRAGKLTRAEFEAKRTAWAQTWRSMMKPRFVPFIWIHGYAGTARTVDDATAALAAMPAYEPIKQYHPHTFADGDIGRVYLLGGKLDDGLAYLRTAGASCLATEFPIQHTRAELALGEALEAKHDTAGACAAYHVVLERWGTAHPRSTTGDLARGRARALACPP